MREKKQVRFVVAFILLVVLLAFGGASGFAIVASIGGFAVGGIAQVLEMWRSQRLGSDWPLFYFSLFVGFPCGVGLTLQVWKRLVVKCQLLSDDELRLQVKPKSALPKDVTPVGVKETVVWILLISVLGGGLSFVGYHLANFPYEGWEGMQRHLSFSEILFPKYPFRVLPIVGMALFGAYGATLAEKIFTNWFRQKKHDRHGVLRRSNSC